MQTLTVEELCKRVRARLIDNHTPLFAMCAWKLTHIEDSETETLSTDGTRIWVNPEFFEGLLPEERTFVYAHEVGHCALEHPYRCGDRDMELWNIACDYVINAMLVQDGIGTAPKGVLVCPERFNNMSAEQIYAILEREKSSPSAETEDKEDAGIKTSDDPGDKSKDSLKGCPTGSFRKAPPEAESSPDDMTSGDWEIAVEQAKMANAKEGGERGGGSTPGTDRAIEKSRQAKASWIDKLWQFAEKTIPSETTWSIPDRRFLALDMYFPSVKRNNMPKLGMGADTSGSITQEWLNLVGSHLSAINTQLRPREMEVVYSNSKIQGVEVFTPDMEVVLHAKGGGGTCDMDFWPIIDYFNAKDEDDKPSAVLVFTDLYGKVPPEPEYPVMWIVPEWSSQPDPPYGETVRVSLHTS